MKKLVARARGAAHPGNDCEQAISDLIAALENAEARLTTAEQIIRDARHDPRCAVQDLVDDYGCNCWKAKTLAAIREGGAT